MEEKIIIDGVDVAGCEFLDGKYCKLCDMRAKLDKVIVNRQNCDRTINKNCYYKQLKRLEQKNEELKEELKNTLKDIDKKLELALDTEQTDADESFVLLYEIQDTISEAIGE